MTKSKKPSAKLKSACEDVLYQFKMMYFTSNWLVEHDAQGREEAGLYHAVLESFLLHSQALIEFLYDERLRAGDAVAGDFFDKPAAWSAKRGKKPALLKDVSERMGAVSRLVRPRRDGREQARRWRHAEIRDAVTDVFRDFLKAAPKQRQSEDMLAVGEQL